MSPSPPPPQHRSVAAAPVMAKSRKRSPKDEVLDRSAPPPVSYTWLSSGEEGASFFLRDKTVPSPRVSPNATEYPDPSLRRGRGPHSLKGTLSESISVPHRGRALSAIFSLPFFFNIFILLLLYCFSLYRFFPFSPSGCRHPPRHAPNVSAGCGPLRARRRPATG